MSTSMPTIKEIYGFRVGETVRVATPNRIVKITIRRFARNTYFEQVKKGATMIETAGGGYYPLSNVIVKDFMGNEKLHSEVYPECASIEM